MIQPIYFYSLHSRNKRVKDLFPGEKAEDMIITPKK